MSRCLSVNNGTNILLNKYTSIVINVYECHLKQFPHRVDRLGLGWQQLTKVEWKPVIGDTAACLQKYITTSIQIDFPTTEIFPLQKVIRSHKDVSVWWVPFTRLYDIYNETGGTGLLSTIWLRAGLYCSYVNTMQGASCKHSWYQCVESHVLYILYQLQSTLERSPPPVVPGGWFNIKMSSYQYRKSHRGDKTVVRSSYLHNGNSCIGKTTSLYWTSALFLIRWKWVGYWSKNNGLMFCNKASIGHSDRLMQRRRNSNAVAIELRLFSIKTSTWYGVLLSAITLGHIVARNMF